MANPDLGAKQICPSCQSKFYDLNRRPAVCPKCGEQFDPEEALKSRRVRARAITPDYDAEDEKEVVAPKEPDGFEDEVDETPEIDEAVEADVVETDDEDGDPTAAPAPGGDDLGVDFAEDEDLAEDEADDVPFLEDEDDDDDLGDEIEGLPDGDDDDR
ncbi:TIGR02300 family protein [Caulobacter hibisci]|uniref:TIGR02300 family protein n=1 Tax=Caulobacter hibisci TaxID=2035993 RepID=A0ABS0SUN2_9CAUL|nr:TIGR02300 family protein [Caulobacter hibisci]MBI1683357.1 TIGR02300 family protein [Caulobacter hibisci]